MKKLSIFAALLLVLGLTGCVEADNPIANSGVKVTVDGVNYQLGQLATFEAPQGTEVSLTLGSWNENGDVIGVDFGDGNIQSFKIGYTNQGPLKEDGTPGALEEHKGTVAGDGIIRIYGNDDIWYADLKGGAMPTTFNQPRLMNLVQLLISNTPAEAFELPALEQLKLFNIRDCENLATIDVSQATALTNLVVNNTAITAIDLSTLTALTSLQMIGNKLTALDLTKNTNLTQLNVSNNKLTTIDLTNNTKLSGANGLNLDNNELTEIKLGADYPKLPTFRASNNKLKSLEVDKLTYLKNLYLDNNEIDTELDFLNLRSGGTINLANNKLSGIYLPVDVKSLDVSNNELTWIIIQDITSKLDVSNNLLSFAKSSLPDKPDGITNADNYIYAPQKTIVKVWLNFNKLNLKAYTEERQGILEKGSTATGQVEFYAEEAILGSNDYTIDEPGLFTFIHSYPNISGVITHDAFPGLAIPTTEFGTQTYGTGAEIFSFANGAVKGGSIVANGDNNPIETEITVNSKKANIDTDNITITLDKPFEANDYIILQAYLKKSDKIGTLYFQFEKDGKEMATIDEGTDPVWNTWIDEHTYSIPYEAVGCNVIKIARSRTQTNVYIKDFRIKRY